MAKLSVEELQKKAEPHFNKFDCSEIYATSDGCFFEVKNKSFATSHAGSHGHELHLIKKAESKPTKKKTPKGKTKKDE